MEDRNRQPTIFLSNGGGPCFWMEFPEPFGVHAFDKLRSYLEGLICSLPSRPRAIVVLSGHWEGDVTTISKSAAPPMLYDYNGFPAHTYQLSYPAPGSPELAASIVLLLTQAGIETATDTKRGFDHGVFVPMLIADPKAEIPIVMLAMRADLDPAHHIAIGAALEPLRDRGVLIIGSGSSYHNLRSFRDDETEASLEFDNWLTHTMTELDAAARNNKLQKWANAPFARECHPREDHLIPLMVVAGSAVSDAGRQAFHDVIGGKTISGFAFG